MPSTPTPVATPTPGGLAVASLTQARRHRHRYDAVITLEDPGLGPFDRLRLAASRSRPHLVLAFEDVDDDSLDLQVATSDQVARALTFANDHRAGSLLIHCLHGVGRSAAVALAILAQRYGHGSEARALENLLSMRPEATPNRVVVSLADVLLGRDGALIAAMDGRRCACSGYASHPPRVRQGEPWPLRPASAS